jgi:hypothetical protein
VSVSSLSGAFVFEQVALEGFAAHDFAGAGGTEALGCGAPGFEFGHEYIWFKTQLFMIPQDELSSVMPGVSNTNQLLTGEAVMCLALKSTNISDCNFSQPSNPQHPNHTTI